MKIQIPQTIEVSANTAVKILYDFFNLPYRNGCYVKRSESGVKGIYYTEDVSTHGSSDIKEFLYSDDEKKVEPFEHLVAIEKLIQEKNNESSSVMLETNNFKKDCDTCEHSYGYPDNYYPCNHCERTDNGPSRYESRK